MRKLLPLAVVAGLIGGIVMARRKRAESLSEPAAHGSPVRLLGRAARNAELAKVGTKTAANYARHRARRAFADADRRAELDTEFELETAEQVAEALGGMKGAMMKIGQMASYLDAGMPEHVRSALAQLQTDAPPMAPALSADVVRDELGADPDQIFAEWDPTPIASASIGQVHRAITHDGRAVAVKVQYPDVGHAIEADLGNADLMFSGLSALFPGMDPEPIVAELKARLIEELDYLLEADNQHIFAEYYEGHPFIAVPAVLEDHSSRRVLTTELASGARWDEMLTWSSDERNLAAEAMYRFTFGSLYRLGTFNGDPHPGNYLFNPGGKVTFLDFGLVKRFTADEMRVFDRQINAMVIERDIAKYRAICEEVGLLQPNADLTDEEVADYFGYFYELVLDDDVTTVTNEYAAQAVRHVFEAAPERRNVMRNANVPEMFVIIQRINLGLVALLGQMEATANWRRLAEEVWPFVDGPPSTPMGEAAAEWAASRADWHLAGRTPTAD